jgi:Uma2 family endonuclease
VSTLIIPDKFRIPAWAGADLDAFRQWVCSDEAPRYARFAFLAGELWADMSPESLYTHNQLKAAFARVLGNLLEKMPIGRFLPDGMLLRNNAARLFTQPDGMFFSDASLEAARVRIVRGPEGYDVLEGTPDMVLEIVSSSSERKDTRVLRQLYWAARIPEYWLVDARTGNVDFTLFRYAKNGYIVARRQAGWLNSNVFGKSFRLQVKPDQFGAPLYKLLAR